MCERPLSWLSIRVPATEVFPQGGFSETGQPLCHEHRVTRCRGCGVRLPYHQMTRRVTGKRLDRETRQGLSPRVEEVFHLFCPECREESSAAPPPRAEHAVLTWLILGLATVTTLSLYVAFRP